MAADFERYKLQYQPEWRMEHEIGSGGFGVVYKEQIRRPGMLRFELCAVKRIPLGIVDHGGDMQRYKREIAILASLVNNEWFVQFFGWHETKDTVFLAMEYMELGDLGRHLGALWSESDTGIVAEQLLKGLCVLHEAGIAHRDLKPQNIFPILMDDGCLRIKIGDFGVSKTVTSNTNTSLRTLISVLGYTAPEMIAHSGSYTNAVDLWSLGCLVYRMLCGEDIFRSLEDIYRYKFNVLPFPRERLSTIGVSHSGVEFIERLLQVNPQHRPTAADALSCSWFSTRTMGYQISSRQAERFRKRLQPPGNFVPDNAETIRPQLAPDLGSEASALRHSSPSRAAKSDAVGTEALSEDEKRSDNVSVYGAGKHWDPSTWECEATLSGHESMVLSVAFSPDSRRLASGLAGGTVELWDLSKGECRAALRGHSDWVRSVAFSPDGKYLASGSDDKTVRLWDESTATCQAILQGHSEYVCSLAFSPDSNCLASGSKDKTIKLWDPSTGDCQATLSGHTDWVKSVKFSPDGKLLVSGSEDHATRLWDPSTGRCEATLKGNQAFVYSAVFSPDGKNVAAGLYDGINLWDLRTKTCQATFKGHTGPVNSVSFSPNGKSLASGSYDTTVRLWDPSTGACQVTLTGHSEMIRSIAFSPDGTCLASASNDKTVKLWGTSRAITSTQ